MPEKSKKEGRIVYYPIRQPDFTKLGRLVTVGWRAERFVMGFTYYGVGCSKNHAKNDLRRNIASALSAQSQPATALLPQS